MNIEVGIKNTNIQKTKYMIKKYCEYYYQVRKIGNGFKYFIYNKYGKDRELLEQGEICDTKEESEQDAKDAISYHYL